MIHYLPGAFLGTVEDYDRSEAFWKELWETVLSGAGRREQWQAPWFPNVLADGTPLRDGNPIFSAVSHALGRGIRVIQHEPSNSGCEIEAWTDSVEPGEGQATMQELVVACSLSEEAARKAEQFIGDWVRHGTLTCHNGPAGRDADAVKHTPA